MKVCSIEGCGPAPRLVKGFCNKHYQAWYKHGDPLYKRVRVNDICEVEGCNSKAKSK